MTDILHPIIILFPTLCVSFFAAKKLGYHASLIFISLSSALALLSGALAIVIPLSQVVLYIYIALYILSAIVLYNHRQTLVETIKTHWIWVLVLTIIYSLWLTMDRIVTRWDNFSHWLLAPKSFNYTTEIFNRDLVDAFSYPPFNPLFLYFSKGFVDFREDHAVFLHLAIVFLLCIPILQAIFKNSPKLYTKLFASILSVLAVFSFLTILMQLTAEIQSFYSDFTAALLIGVSSYLLYKLVLSNHYKALLLTTPLLFALTLVRAGGLALALAVLGVYCLTAFVLAVFKVLDRRHSFITSSILFTLMIICVGLNVGWESSVKMRHGNDAFINNMHFDTSAYFKILFDGEDEKAKPVRNRIFTSFTQHTNLLPRTPQGSLLDRVTNRSAPNSLGYWLGILALLSIIATIQVYKNRQRRLVFIIAFIIMLGTLALYMLTILMTAYVQNNLLGSFPRYSFIYIAGIMIYLHLVIFTEEQLRHKWLIALFSITILTTTPFVLGSIFKNPVGVVRDATFDNKENMQRNEARLLVRDRANAALTTEAASEVMKIGDKAYVIMQGSNSYLYWLARGELGGIGANDNSCPHVVVPKQNKIVERRCPYTAQELYSILKTENYDWLFVGHAGEGFRTYISEISTGLPENFLASGEESFLLKVEENNLTFTKYLSSSQ